MKLSIITLLVCVCVPCTAQTATLSCSPKLNPDTCHIASNNFHLFTSFVRPFSQLRTITILDPESYRKENKQFWSANPGTDMDLQILSGPYAGEVLFERDGSQPLCPTSVFISSDVIDANSEMVLDEKGQPKLDSNGRVSMRELPPTELTKTLRAMAAASFLDGYTQGCAGGVKKFSAELDSERERNKRK